MLVNVLPAVHLVACVGVAAYVHGPQTDRPLAVQRFGYPSFAPFAEVMHYDHNQQADVPSFANGAAKLCTDDADTLCVVSGMHQFRFARPPHGATNVLTPPPYYWNGELLTGQQNSSGHMYKRNRYYDPTTGQFLGPNTTASIGPSDTARRSRSREPSGASRVR